MSSKQDDVNLNKPGAMSLKSSEEKDLKLQILPGKTIKLPENEPGAASVQSDVCHADGPGSRKGNEGAASSVRSIERVRSAIDGIYGSKSPNTYMSQLSNEEKDMAIVMMNTLNYTYKELSQATDGFKVENKLGQGKFGAVYFGLVKNTKCAIKKLFQVSCSFMLSTVFRVAMYGQGKISGKWNFFQARQKSGNFVDG